ncbi:MAG TPA: hypothetical protein PKC30_12940 [Saprospiraceae bacterium]|nr:hypothetical protein [Saprospiraceae bacterium]
MKNSKLCILLIVSCFFSFILNAQELVEQKVVMSKGANIGFYQELHGATKKDAEKLWRDHLKSFTKKINSKKGEFTTEGAVVPLINGTSALSLIARFDEGIKMTTIFLWVDLGGVYLNSEDHPTQHTGLQRFMTEYYNNVQKEVFLNMLKDEENNLKSLERDLDRLEKRNEGLHKDIRDSREKIKAAELSIEQNLKDQDDAKEKIRKQKQKIEKVIQMANNVGKET